MMESLQSAVIVGSKPQSFAQDIEEWLRSENQDIYESLDQTRKLKYDQ